MAASWLLLFCTCSKKKDGAPVYYFKGSVNNVQTNWIITDPDETGDINYTLFVSSSRFPDVVPNPNYFFTEMALGCSIFDESHDPYSGIRVYIVKKLPDPYLPADVNGVTELGQYSFGKHYQNSGITQAGAIIWYTDKNGNDWYTEKGSNTAPGDIFEVIEKVSSPYNSNQAIWKVKVNCNVYNDSGSSIRINGEFRAPVLITI